MEWNPLCRSTVTWILDGGMDWLAGYEVVGGVYFDTESICIDPTDPNEINKASQVNPNP